MLEMRVEIQKTVTKEIPQLEVTSSGKVIVTPWMMTV
jgi:hypothetical protein